MDAASFTELAIRVISREATADERRALEAELSSIPARREEFELLKLTHEILRATTPAVQAVRAITPGLPTYRVNELRTAVRQHFGPAAARTKKPTAFGGWIPALRWLFAGSGTAAIGLYGTDLARGGDQSLTASDVPTARLVTFDQDAPLDAWQSQPLAWNEHAKIWVDNEHDLLYVTHRVRHGQVFTETYPLAPTDSAQREQIRQVVDSLNK
jgi:hypothetical protein